ncbi:MAG TPA: hypothetical protein VMD59_07655 [Acidimicrobiales bacterium]|nr:hypothetical protein [Acidimicrobiales bacterium]
MTQDVAAVYTVAYNRPDLIELQLASLRRLLREPFTYTVLNNAPDGEMDGEIVLSCAEAGVACVPVPERSQRSANVSHAWALQWAWVHHVLPIRQGVAVFLDHDVFLVAPFSFVDLVSGHHLAALEQRRGQVVYPWPGIIALDMERIPRRELMSFLCNPHLRGERVDVGGNLSEWIDNVAGYEDGRVDWYRLATSTLEGPEGYEEDFGFELYEGSLLHYHAASNWDRRSHHARKTDYLRRWLAVAAPGTET